jgi:hypothetical protein
VIRASNMRRSCSFVAVKFRSPGIGVKVCPTLRKLGNVLLECKHGTKGGNA